MRNEVRAAFTDIADQRWACGWGDDDQTWRLGCDLRGGGEFAPAVTFEAFDAPVDLESTLSEERSEHLERVAQDHSGYQSRLTLLETRDWVPDAGGEVWGHVSRWQVDYNQPDAGYPVYSEVLRYADKPFGVTVSRPEPRGAGRRRGLTDPSGPGWASGLAGRWGLGEQHDLSHRGAGLQVGVRAGRIGQRVRRDQRSPLAGRVPLQGAGGQPGDATGESDSSARRGSRRR